MSCSSSLITTRKGSGDMMYVLLMLHTKVLNLSDRVNSFASLVNIIISSHHAVPLLQLRPPSDYGKW